MYPNSTKVKGKIVFTFMEEEEEFKAMEQRQGEKGVLLTHIQHPKSPLHHLHPLIDPPSRAVLCTPQSQNHPPPESF